MGKEKAEKNDVKEVTCTYQKDSKRYFRYVIDENEFGIVGNVYMPKDKEKVDQLSMTFQEK